MKTLCLVVAVVGGLMMRTPNKDWKMNGQALNQSIQ